MSERVSLIEKYNNKDVITQIALLKDQVNTNTETVETAEANAKASAESAQTAQQNAEKAKADAETAKNGAEQSATTVAGYNQRLKDVETSLNNLIANAVKLKGELSQLMEGDLQTDGDIIAGNLTALNGTVNAKTVETEDIDATGTANLFGLVVPDTGSATVPNTTTGTVGKSAVNGTRLQNDLDNYDAMVRIANAQTVAGRKLISDYNTCKRMILASQPIAAGFQATRNRIAEDSTGTTVTPGVEILSMYMSKWGDSLDKISTSRGFGFSIPSAKTGTATKQTFLEVRVNHSTGDCIFGFNDTLNTFHILVSWVDPNLIIDFSGEESS